MSRSRNRTRTRNQTMYNKRSNSECDDGMDSGSYTKLQKGKHRKPGNMTSILRTNFVLKHEEIDSDSYLRLKQLELKSNPQLQCSGSEANGSHQNHAFAPLEWPYVAFQQSDVSDEECIEYLNRRTDASSDFKDSSDSIRITSIHFGSKYFQDRSTKVKESWVH